jgi:hypothetical protein
MIGIIITFLCIIFVYIADKSDEGKRKIWVLGPIGVWIMIIYWLFRIISEICH